MNDTELDEILNKWEAPPAPVSLRAKVQAGFSTDRPRRQAPGGRWHWITFFTPRKTVLGGIALVAGALLCLVTLALSQTLILSSPPYTVESKCVRFADERGHAAEMILTSYNDKGSEIVLSRSLPGNLFATVATRVTDAAGALITRFTWPVFKPEQLEIIKTQAGVSTGFQHWYLGSAAELLQHGCVNGPVVGREKILDYQTTAVEYRQGNYFKFTVWRAPDLGCFALRVTDEERQDDGTYRLMREKRAFHVMLNH
jgi:hypothetical protein